MNKEQEYEFYLKRCFQLAKLGKAAAAPNPSVGAVLVYKDRIIAEGYTSAFGGNHAEVNCINSVSEKDVSLFNQSTLYVSLEPCNHFGKTPPCSHLIVEKKIPKVVIASVDSNTLVKGNGIAYLQANGVEVIHGILDEIHQQFLKNYFTFQQKKRPHIILNWAETNNGFMAPESDQQLWISNSCIFNALSNENKGKVKLVKINFNQPVLLQILDYLFSQKILSLIVEGGIKTLQYFINAQLWDEAIIIKSNVYWEKGIPAPRLSGKLQHQLLLNQDLIEYYTP